MLGKEAALSRVPKHQCVGEVIDVFGGAGEVDELAHRLELGVALDPLLQEVLDRLDVVIGGALDFLDAPCGRLVKIRDDGIEPAIRVLREARDLGDARMPGQTLEPAHLDGDAVADQPELAEDRPELGGLSAVAPVQRRDRGELRELHVHS